jgi:putative sigma-54 modulation protein
MRIEFHADGQMLSTDLREHIETALRRAFRRFARRVRAVRVYLWDVNGPRGGADKGVRLIVELAPSGEVLVREIAASEFAAVAAAVSRARHAVREELRRRWARRRREAQREREAVAS